MSINIIGDVGEIQRIEIGFYSLDRAFINRRGNIGVPIGIAYEIFGPTGCGKSTLVYGLSGLLAGKQEKFIVLADFEGFDPDFLTDVLVEAEFSGSLNYISEDDDEAALDKLLVNLRDEDYAIGILDSVGAISPISELEGELGEANMGRRAKLMAQFTRKAIHLMRNSADKKTIFVINHVHPNLGSRGTSTPGGETLKYLSSIRIRVKRSEEFPDGSYVLEGTVYKNRWGYRDRKFYIFMLAGFGMHRGLTAMYDGTLLGKVERKKVIKIEDRSFGYMKNIVDEAKSGNDEFFQPFIDTLKGETNEIESPISGDDTETELED